MNRNRKDTGGGKVAQKLRILAEKSWMISTHSHSLYLTRMNNLQVRDKKGEIRYTFDGTGAFCCRTCLKLGYSEAHHCRQCSPTYDVCVKCFMEQKAKDIGTDNEAVDQIPQQSKRKQSCVVKRLDDDIDDYSSEGLSSEEMTTDSILSSAECGDFTNLLALLFPSQNTVDLTAEAQGQTPISINYASVDPLTGKSLLHHAAGHGNGKVVLGLLMRITKDQCNVRDNNGLTPLMISSMKGSTEVVDELLYGSVTTDSRCDLGYTALMLAACYGWPDIVSRLIFSGADVNAQSHKGRTALAMASLNGNWNCVHRLNQCKHLYKGLKDSEGYTPLLLAAARNHQNVVELFSDQERSILKWYRITMFLAVLLCGVVASLPSGFYVIDPSEYSSNLRSDYNWGLQNVPFIDLPKGVGYDDIITSYYYRWRSYKTHINLTPEGFYVITEFGPPVPWAGKYNTIPAAAGHHIMEGRWIHNQQYVDDYIRFWFLWGGDPRKYTSWITHAAYERFKLTNNKTLFHNLTKPLSDNVLGWEREHFSSYGGRNCFWQNDGADAMEVSISGSGCRPTINSVIAKEAEATIAIANLMNETSDIPIQNLTTIRSHAINAVLNQQWNPSIQSFAVMPMGSPSLENTASSDPELTCPGNGTAAWKLNETVSVRELLGFVPFYFSIPISPSPRDSDYKAMWRQLFNENGFASLYGPRTAELRHPCYNYSWSHRDCWNGPTWPYETARLLTAAGTMVRNYKSVEALNKTEYNNLLKQYAMIHVNTYAVNDTAHPLGSGHVFELVHPDMGYWIDRDGLYKYNASIKDVGDDYNHSTFVDIIISGLFGILPQLSGVVIDPLFQNNNLSYFAIDHVLCKGKIISILFDRSGDRYNKGKGFIVFVNGQVVSHTTDVTRVVLPETDFE